MATVDDITYEQLTKLPLVRCYEKAFRKATGLALKLVPARTPMTRASLGTRQNALCRIIARDRASGKASWEITEGWAQHVAGETSDWQTVHCFPGLRVVAAPVLVGDSHVATWICGQVLWRKPRRADFKKVASQLAHWGIQEDLTQMEAAFVVSRVFSTDRLQAIGDMLHLFAEHVGQSLDEEPDRLWIACHRGEPRWVTRAKEFVRAHIAEPITGRRLAAIVHVSPDYFVRVFQEATRVPFMEYVLGLRIERAKALLAEPSMRIEQVACAAGFGSVPEFRAVFGKHVGMSPAQYRAYLHDE